MHSTHLPQEIRFVLNGKSYLVQGQDIFKNLAAFLREELLLVGTKVVCEEGDCGACSVLIAEIKTGHIQQNLHYQVINSCIFPLYAAHNHHIVTVEGVKVQVREEPTEVQKAMALGGGSQCGYCTPGFVMTITELLEHTTTPSEEQIKNSLTGNLCRCTGYQPIINSIKKIALNDHQRLNDIYPPLSLVQALEKIQKHIVKAQDLSKTFMHPTSLTEALSLLGDCPQAKISSGHTDLGVLENKKHKEFSTIVSLRQVKELNFFKVEANWLWLGAGLSITKLREEIKTYYPEFANLLNIFASPQIKNQATIAGNIANASPIADTLPFLMVVGAKIEVKSAAATREVEIRDFFKGYKQLDLKPGELISSVKIPLPQPKQSFFLYKISKRRDLDIATVSAAFMLNLSSDLLIDSISIAFGGVGPMVLRMPEVEQQLKGQEWNLKNLTLAGELAANLVTPLSDVRGSKEYRSLLVRNLFVKCYYDYLERLNK